MYEVTRTSCIRVVSPANSWIDIVVIPRKMGEGGAARRIIEKAFNDYWEEEEARCLTMSEYIELKLAEGNIEADIYYGKDDGGTE